MKIPNCIKGNKAINICANQKCFHPNPFMCANCKNNLCKSLHSDCMILVWDNLKNKLEKKKNSISPGFINACTAIQQLIRNSIKNLQQQLKNFNQWKALFLLPTEAENFLKSIEQNQQGKFNGKQIAKIISDLKVDNPRQTLQVSQIQYQIKQVTNTVEKLQKMIRQMYSNDEGDIKIKRSTTNIELSPKKVQTKLFWEATIKSIQQSILKPIELGEYKIKEKYLDDLYKILYAFQQKPIFLQLKFLAFSWSAAPALKQFAKSLQNPNFKSVKIIKLYYPWIVGTYIECQHLITASLINLPQIQSVYIIAHGIRSLVGFSSLGNKLKESVDQGWYLRQKW